MEKGLNAPLTSSFGRVFDAISSFANLLHTQSYEGETGLQIEKYYDENISESYSFELIDNRIVFSKAIKEIIEDKDTSLICSKFINMLVKIICKISIENSHLKVILTGGVFQNKTVLNLLIKNFDKINLKYYFNKKIPINDQGLSLGQSYYKVR